MSATAAVSLASPRGPIERPGAAPAVTLLTVYLAILWGVPSAYTIGPLGSLGVPSALVGLACLAYWGWSRIRCLGRPKRPLQPVRLAYLAFFSCVWLSYAFAQARSLPADEVSPSTAALLMTLSWAGVVLLANDGLTNLHQVGTLLRRLSLFGGLFALLGLAQFITGDSLIDRIEIPGLTVNPNLLGVMSREGFVRASATATHPLEYAAVLAGVLPIGIALAIVSTRGGLIRRWWVPVVTGIACLLSVSRSAIIGFVVGIAVMVPALSWRARVRVMAGLTCGLAFVFVAAPGMLGSIAGLFLNGADSSTASRTTGLSVAASVITHHPVLGRGFGTFLPKYYILDNQLALLLIEVGVLGFTAFLMIAAAAMVQSQRARRVAGDPGLALLAHSLTAAVAAIFSLFAFFDALSFGMAAGTFALLVGVSGAIYNAVRSDVSGGASGSRDDEERSISSNGSIGGAAVGSGVVIHVPNAQLRRQGPRTALAVCAVAVLTVAVWTLLLRTQPVYWTRSDVFIAQAHVSDEEVLLVPPDEDLVPFATAVEAVLNGGHPVTRLNSKEATLYGLGYRHGVSIHLRNVGSQWAPLFPDPVLVVETVAATGQEALEQNRQARELVHTVVEALQTDQRVPTKSDVRAVAVLEDPTMVRVGAGRRGLVMAIAASGLVGFLLMAGCVVLGSPRRVE